MFVVFDPLAVLSTLASGLVVIVGWLDVPPVAVPHVVGRGVDWPVVAIPAVARRPPSGVCSFFYEVALLGITVMNPVITIIVYDG